MNEVILCTMDVQGPEEGRQLGGVFKIIQVRDIDYLKEGEWEERGENLKTWKVEIEAIG